MKRYLNCENFSLVVPGGGHLFSYLVQRAKSHQKHREQYMENLEKSERQERVSYIVPPTFSTKNPQPGEARRWLKQVSIFI